MDGLHWPGYEIVCHFSVVEVVLEMPALFEDILIHIDVWAKLTNLHIATALKQQRFSTCRTLLVNFDARCAYWVG
jgi:hypothetical protein